MLRLSKVKEFMKSHLIIVSTIIIVLLILAGVSYSLLYNTPPTEPLTQVTLPIKPPEPSPQATPPIKPPEPPRESKPPPEPPLSFEQKIANLKKAVADVCATGESREVTLVFTETEANNQAAKLLAQTEIPEDIPLEIESVHIDFQPDNNVLTEARSAIYKKFKVTLKVKAQVGIKEGKPKVEVTSINFGFVPLPKPLKDKISDFITQKIGALQSLAETELGSSGKINLEFRVIRIQESTVTITLIIKTKA